MLLLLPTRFRLSTCLSLSALTQLVLLRPAAAFAVTQSAAAVRSSCTSAAQPPRASASAVGETMPFPTGTKPAKEVDNPRPKLWIYDHCPYCIRPR